MTVEVLDSESVYRGLFGDIERYKLKYALPDGTMAPAKREISKTEDLVGVLLVDPDEEDVILCEPFRFPTYAHGRRRGWILETFTGTIRSGEVPDHARVRELMDDVGVSVDALTLIATFFSAPDRLTQRVFLYFAEGGYRESKDEDDEDIRIYRISLRKFFAKLKKGEFEDPKVIIAGHWLRQQPQFLDRERDGEREYRGDRTIAGVDAGRARRSIREDERDLRNDPDLRDADAPAGRARRPIREDEREIRDNGDPGDDDPPVRRRRRSIVERAVIGLLGVLVLGLLVVAGLLLAGN